MVDGSAITRPILKRAAQLAGFTSIIEASSANAALAMDLSGVDAIAYDCDTTELPAALFRERLEAELSGAPGIAFVSRELQDISPGYSATTIIKPFSPEDFETAVSKILPVTA